MCHDFNSGDQDRHSREDARAHSREVSLSVVTLGCVFKADRGEERKV